MAPVAPAPSTNGAGAGASQHRLAKPFSDRAKRSITKQTSRLIELRKQLSQQLRRDFERRFQCRALKKNKIPPRELRKLKKVLVKRERAYIEAMAKMIEEKERFHRQDPSSERSIDLQFLKTQRQRFERHLVPKLAGRERPIPDSGEENGDVKGFAFFSDTTSEHGASNAQKQLDTSLPTGISAMGPCNDNNEAVEQDVAERKAMEKTQNIQKSGPSGLDGAFDDDSKPSQSKKRKRGDEEKEQHKEAKRSKKEQTTKDKQMPSFQPKAQAKPQPPKAQLKPTKAVSTGKDTATSNNMSQSKEGKANGAGEKNKYPLVRINGKMYEVEKAPAEFDLESDDEEHKYQKMARAMLHPDYNDRVHRLARKPKPDPNKYRMHGALMKNPETDFFCSSALPTPPASDEADNTDRQAPYNKRSTFKKRASPATEPRANVKARRFNNKMRSRSNFSAP